MALFKPRTPPVKRPPALTSAIAPVILGPGSPWSNWRYGNRDFQREAWRLYDIVGELRFLAAWIGDSVSQARLYVTEISQTGEETGEVEDEAIARLAAIPLGTGSQRDDNLRLWGIDLAVAGEAWVVGEDAASEDPGGWWVLTSGQIDRQGEMIAVERPLTRGGGTLSLRDGQDILIRSWRPHPNSLAQPDSPTRSAIPPLREIELVTKRQFAELESRLTGAGLLLLPDDIDFPRGEGDVEGLSGFMSYLQRAMMAPIQNQETASAMVPIIATVPEKYVEHLDKIKVLTFWSELSAELAPMKTAAIERVAAAFEIPSELLSGLGNANHWTAWAISEEGIKRIKPYLAYIADALTRGFLHDALERIGVDDPERYAYAFDTAPLAVRPNRLDEALQLNDRGLLSDEETVKAGAFTPQQMPTEDERLRALIYAAIKAQPTAILDPGVQAMLGFRLPASATIEPAPAPAPAEIERAPERGTPDTLEEGPPTGSAPDTAAITQRLVLGSARLIVLRALELAGGRLTTPAERRGRWAAYARHELHTRVGPITPDRADKVLDGAWLHVRAVSEDVGVPEAELQRLLQGYCRELLCRGMAHHDDLLATALKVAIR